MNLQNIQIKICDTEVTMSSRSHSPMEQGEIEASPDLHGSPGIILDPDDDYVSRQTTRSSDKEKPGKSKRDSRSPDRSAFNQF